ncbi:unnamed protein product [Arabidopsis lyrata]|nr:unnamed protein product [Arabidopsis lyrata]
MFSLRSRFDYSRMNRNKPLKKRSGGGLLPVFDESHVMASELAGYLLYRRITPHEISMFPFSLQNSSMAASVLLNHAQSLSVGSHGFSFSD